MVSNTQLLHVLFDLGALNLESIKFLREPAPMPYNLPWEKVEGMLLGLAIGDALGATSESKEWAVRTGEFGYIRDYQPNPKFDNEERGFPTDDTQMAFWLLEHLVKNKYLDPDKLAEIFSEREIFGMGKSVREFRENYGNGMPWYKAAPESAGNGALMRIAPILVPYIRKPSAEMWADTIIAATVTHNDRASTAACVALVRVLWDCLRMGDILLHNSRKDFPEWLLDTWCGTMKKFEGTETKYESRDKERFPDAGNCWKFAKEQVKEALEKNMPVEEACEIWGSGAYLPETIPSVLYILCRHYKDFEDGVCQAVNYTRDNDTIAAIVGAVLGSLHGSKKIPQKWIKNLSGRTTIDNEGEIFRLLHQAKVLWWKPKW